MTDQCCLWCCTPFKPRTDGLKAQRFCRALCRKAFYAACRTWAVQGVLDGALSLEQSGKPRQQRARWLQRKVALRAPGAALKVIASPTPRQRLASHMVHFWSRPTFHTTGQRGEMWLLRC